MPEPQIIPPGEEEVREVPLTSNALAILNKSEIEQQVEIAKKYPRSIDKFRTTLDKYTNLNQEVALTMFYSLKRRRSDGTEAAIVGPSVRFMETLLPCWTNCRGGTRPMGEQGNVITAQGVFFDCETNTGVSVEAARSIVGKGNKKFSADMITVTGNAASSIAYRNAVGRGVPRSLWLDIYEKSKRTAVGAAESFAGQVAKAVEEFAKQGVTQVALLNTLGATSVRDITADHILTMRTLFREIRDGDKTIEEVFGSPEDEEINALMVELGWNATKQRMSLEAFKGKRSDHLAFLKGEAVKAGKVTQAATTAAADKPGPQAVKGKKADKPKPATTDAVIADAEKAGILSHHQADEAFAAADEAKAKPAQADLKGMDF